ncbi:DUF4340 domain-containing protein [Oleiharenicola sp. Vm1]|uniref:DUF4340 domain-containing protein n=1 Tax=Oleiharenicola sp. Vm1 TaxID=3398393 RepID=UPI0039F5AADC
MRSKVTVVLLFLNVVLFYYIFNYENRVQIHETTKRVLGAETTNVEKFTRTSRNAPTVTAEKRGDNWWLTQPFEWPANRNAVDHVLHELQFLEHETSFAVADLAKSGQSLADYGLTEPAMTFTFTSAGKDYALRIGDRTEIGNRLYLLSPDGTRIHVVNRGLADSLGLGADQLRSDAVFTIPVFEIRSLALQTANAKTRLRRESQRWMIEAPIQARAAKAETETTLTELTGLQVRRFLEARDADPAKTGLAAPALRVTLEGNARRETLLLGHLVGPAPAATGIAPVEVYAKLEDKPAVFVTRLNAGQLSGDQVGLLDRLRLAQDKLRDKHVLDFDFANVTALTLAAPDRPELSLQRLDAAQGAAESWQVVVRGAAGQAPQTLPADPAIVQDFLQRLKFLTASKFLSDAPSAADLESYGFNRPEREITLNLRTGGGPKGDEPSATTLQIGTKPAAPSVAYARVANANAVYEIPPDLLEDVPVSALHFRQRVLRELPEGTHVTALTLTDLTNNSVVVALNAAAGGELTAQSIAASDAPEAKRAAFTTLLAEVRKLRAKRFVADSFDRTRAAFNGANPAWRYRLDAALTLAGGSAQNTTAQLYLTERLGGTTQLGGIEELNVTYELPQELVDALFALTYAPQHDPGPPPAAPAVTTPAPAPAEKPKG